MNCFPQNMLAPALIVDDMLSAFRAGKLRAISHHWATDIVYEAPGISTQGKAARIAAEQVWLTAFSDNCLDVVARYQVTDEVIDFCTMSGCHSGPILFPGGGSLPATNKQISGTFVSRYRIRNGKVIFQQVIYDRLALMKSLGAAPAA
jgi:hypothetical protein